MMSITSIVKIYINASGSGWGAVINIDGQKQKISGKIDGTRFAAIVRAATESLRLLPEASQVIVYSDLEYLTMGASNWVKNWASHGWYKLSGEEISNRDEWEALFSETCRHKITWQHPERYELGINEALNLARAANRKIILPAQQKEPSPHVEVVTTHLETIKSQPEKRIFPMIPDDGTDIQRQNYVELLQKTIQIYDLIGLPPDVDTLFNGYELPKNVPCNTPNFVFLDYPQRPQRENHDFTTANLSTARTQCGPANVLYNQDFTLVFGRVSSTKEHYGYSILLLRNDELRVYTMFHTIDRKVYRYSHDAILSDLQELVILAFYSRKNRIKLEKYIEGNSKVVHFLKSGYIEYDSIRYWPITCFNCKEARYISRLPQGHNLVCNDCAKQMC